MSGYHGSGLAALLAVVLLPTAVSAQPSFTETTGAAGFSHRGESYGASWGDLNGDGWPDLFVNNHRTKVSLYRNNGNGKFTNVIDSADADGVWVVKPKQDTHGVAWADVDNDGDQDIYVTTGAADLGRLLINDGGVFHERAGAVGLAQDVEGRLPVWVDYDRDGRLDLAIMIRSASRLFHQRAVAALGFDLVSSPLSTGCKQMDYGQLSDLDGDGTMELICGDGVFPQRVYDITTFPFTDVTSTVDRVPRGTDTAIADFDGDLDPDAFALAGAKIPSGAELTGSTRLEASLGAPPNTEKGFSVRSTGVLTIDTYVKRQLRDVRRIHIGSGDLHPADFSFILDPADPATHGITPHDPGTSDGIFIGYDPGTQLWTLLLTGLEDHAAGAYFVVNSSAPMSDLEIINPIRGDLPERPYLLVNTPSGLVKQGTPQGLTDEVLCISVAAADYDNDMDVDAYAVCRGAVRNLPNRLYENLGNGTFQLVSSHGAEGVLGFHLADGAGLGESVTTADYDGDGCIDLFVTNGLPLEPGRHKSGPDQMFRNRCNYGNHWLQLDLRGLGVGASNRDGIGAKVYVMAGGVSQLREQNGGYHRWSQSFQRLHFGLGANATVQEVRVEWPDGRVDQFSGPIQADRFYRVDEGASVLQPVALGSGPPPEPEPGAECSSPSIDRGVEAGIFLWRDCPGNTWHLRATADGNTLITYDGRLTSEEALAGGPDAFSIENNDTLLASDPFTVLFTLKVKGSGWDGFEVDLSDTGRRCLTLSSPAGAGVFVGGSKRPVPSNVDLGTLETCN